MGGLKRLAIYGLSAAIIVGGIVALVSLVPKRDRPEAQGSRPLKDSALSAIPENSYILSVSQDAGKLYADSDEVKFQGRVAGANSAVSINDQRINIGKDGVLESSFSMHPGENRFAFVFENSTTGKREEKTFRWILDVSPPAFFLSKPVAESNVPQASSEVDIQGEFFLADKEAGIEDGVIVQANGETLSIAKNRRGFSGHIRLPDGKHEIKISATDPAGNKAETTARVRIDSYPSIITIKDFKVVSGEGSVPSVHFDGSVNEPADIRLAGRPVFANEKGEFAIGIYLSELELARKSSNALITATDIAGNKSTTELPKGGDFMPPHWLSLQSKSVTDGVANLEGKISEGNATVQIGNVTATANPNGEVLLSGVSFDREHPVVETVLKDNAGNEARIEQWVASGSAE